MRKPLEERAGRWVPCAACGTQIWRPDARLRRVTRPVCSRTCNGVFRGQEWATHGHKGRSGWAPGTQAAASAKMTGALNPAWKGGVTVFRKHGNYAGVRYVRAPGWALPMARKDGYIMEHRLQMAVLCGYLLTRTEVINHENHVPSDNHPGNLTLWPDNSSHKRYEHGNFTDGASCRVRQSPHPGWSMPEWSGASPSQAAHSLPDVTG
jgi:endogenous inhibitor of DNA gyrase (YacG/DUF329 family)